MYNHHNPRVQMIQTTPLVVRFGVTNNLILLRKHHKEKHFHLCDINHTYVNSNWKNNDVVNK